MTMHLVSFIKYIPMNRGGLALKVGITNHTKYRCTIAMHCTIPYTHLKVVERENAPLGCALRNSARFFDCSCITT